MQGILLYLMACQSDVKTEALEEGELVEVPEGKGYFVGQSNPEITTFSLLSEIQTGDLVISEVMHTPQQTTYDSYGEWIELHNAGSVAIDLNGLEISSSNNTGVTFANSLVVEAGAYVVLGTRSSLNGGIDFDGVYSSASIRHGINDDLSIGYNGGVLDSVSWNRGLDAITAGRSFSLDGDDIDATLNDSEYRWYAAQSTYGDGDYGTPGLPNLPLYMASELTVGDLVITEIMHNPEQVYDRYGEWFEVLNKTDGIVQLYGLSVDSEGEDGFTVDTNQWSAPAALSVFANRAASSINGGLPFVDVAWSASLVSLGQTDTLSLSNSNGNIDEVSFDKFTWGRFDGVSLNLSPIAADATSNDSGSMWCAAETSYGDGDLGTPGSVNADCPNLDFDGDGVTSEDGDCDDTDAAIGSGDAQEICDGIDNDCDGLVDEADDSLVYTEADIWYLDFDGDGYGTESSLSVYSCDTPTDDDPYVGNPYVRTSDDCDDFDATVLGTSVDADCDRLTVDADCDDTDPEAYAIADDGDCDGVPTFGDCDDNDAGSTIVDDDADCDGVLTASDCDDNDAGSTVRAEDYDCDGTLTADDCNDFNSGSTIVADDADCDGVLTANDCDDADSTSTVLATDADCDGVLTAVDCNDADNTDAALSGDCDQDGVATSDDCDDTDAGLGDVSLDADCDGVLTADDCDDTDASSTVVADDGDCDGVLTADDCDDADSTSTVVADDADCDGVLTADDCDDADATLLASANDADCDGVLTALDCDDADTAVGSTDADGDGFIACVDDCDDTDPNLYPGVAFNEADTTLCVADADGDGYASSDLLEIPACIDIEMVDGYGDGWNGNEIEIYEGGVLTGTYANDSAMAANEVQTEQHCFQNTDSRVNFVFNDGSYNSEVSFTISDTSTGSVIGSGQGSGTLELVWNDTTYSDGDTFFTNSSGGTDCDDADPAIGPTDDDGDGFIACIDDCDDNDASLNADDLDADGYSTCDGDCNDDATDADGDGVADGAAFNPGTSETWYDGVDSDCSGGSDYDQDGDGALSGAYVGTCSDTSFSNQSDCESAGTCSDAVSTDQSTCETAGETWTAHTWTATGMDCNDTSDKYTTLPNESDPTACYYDDDGDGFGVNALTVALYEAGVTAGTDCYDSYDAVYPGAAYNELDVDGDGNIDCTMDVDGDGYGDAVSANSYNAVYGTDCDDADASIGSIDLDADCDGSLTENDCDDAHVLLGDISNDADCDGVLSTDDCDDSDDTSEIVARDTDCDGVVDVPCGLTDCDTDLYIGGGQTLSFNLITAGTFMMGSPESEVGRDSTETQHEVTLTNNFYVLTTEVTREMFYQLMGPDFYDYTRAEITEYGSNTAANQISWHMAAAYSNAVTAEHNARMGTALAECYTCTGDSATTISCSQAVNPYTCTGYRLLTEAEWEYAARAGTTAATWTANGGASIPSVYTGTCNTSWLLSDGTLLGDYAWFCGNGDGHVEPVAQLQANDNGLYDMMGNVYEWTHGYQYSHPSTAQTDPNDNTSSYSAILRSSSYGTSPSDHRSASRHNRSRTNRDTDYGFRIGRTE